MIQLLKQSHNINEVDTFFFSNASERDNFFSKDAETVIVSSFYPPYYKNNIRLSIEDYDIYSSSCEYLRIDFRNKYYYYFIKRINYINENVYSLDIEMDTIMTYMFDIELVNTCINRKFINRFNTNGTINRNYIRENVSSNEQVLSYMKDYVSDGGFFIIRMSSLPSSIITRTDYDLYAGTILPSNFNIVNGYINMPSQMYYFIIPYNKYIVSCREVYYNYYDKDTSELIKSIKMDLPIANSLNYIASLPEVFDITFVPFSPFEDVKLLESNNVNIYIKSFKKAYDIDNRYIPKFVITYCSESAIIKAVMLSVCSVTYNDMSTYDNILDVYLKQYEHIFNFDFIKNITRGNDFVAKFCPVLMDENYMNITFGNRNIYSMYPLFNALSSKLNLKYLATITGNIITSINCDNELVNYVSVSNSNYLDDKYNVSVINTDKLYGTLFNDAWKQYYAYNKASVQNNFIDQAIMGLQGINNIVSGTKDVLSIMNKASSFDRRYNYRNVLRKKPKQQLLENIFDTSEDATSNLQQLLNEGENITNLKLSPVTIKNDSNVLDGMMSMLTNLQLKIYRCNDYEQVAQYYHHNGYLVNEFKDENISLKELYNYINTRYYFNIMKLSLCEVHSKTITISQDIIDDIKNRLYNGLRFWNITEDDIGNYKYDNVERSNL